MPITRQSYFQPTQISGCISWYDATDSSTITLSSGSLTQWNDKSGNGRNLTAVSGFANATVSSAYQNGLNVFNFSGNGLYRTAAGNVSYPQDVYIIVALKSLTTHVDVLGMGDTASDNFNSLTFAESAASRWHNGSSFGARQTISTTNETSLSFLLIQWSIANGNYLLRRNGTQLIQASQTYSFNAPSTSAFQIGYRHPNVNSANFSGYIGEIVVFNSQIGSTQRQQVETYLAQKWGLSASLPADHPGLTTILYKNQPSFLAKIPYFAKFSPTQIPGCRLWLDGTDPAGNGSLPANGASISTWVDKSGNSNSPTSSSGTYPTYSLSSKCVSWNGGAAQLTFPNTLHSAVVGTAFTIFFVEKRTIGSENFIVRGTSQGTNLNLLIGHGGGSAATAWRFAFYGNDLDYTGLPTYVTGEAATISCFMYSKPNRAIYHNGSISASVSDTNASDLSSWTGAMIGGNSTWPAYYGNVFEMIIYATSLSTTQRQQVESYLAQKWTLSLVLPAAHLNTTFPAGAPTAIQPYVPSIRPALVFVAVPTYILKYTYTGSNQSFVVPSGVTSVTVYMWGAGGGAGLGGNGGAGCYVQGVLTVVPGETLTIVVGQGGGNKARALGKSYGGGGAGGGPDGGRSDIPSSQGGGRSAIVRSSTDLVTAAAGGGGRGGRGGRGRLVTGENGTGQATGGTQSAGGTNNGGLYTGGDANQDNSAAGGSGYYGGGGGGQDQAGGGGSCLTSNLSLIAGQSTFGTESSDGSAAPQTSSPYYNSDVGFGATSAYGYNYGSGGNGLVVIGISSKTAIASVSYSRLILSAWFGSVAYRYGLDVTTVVNNAFGGNPSNTITLNVATLTNPQIGTTKYTYIVYMFNGIQKFSSPYAEGTVLTFSSLT